MRPLHYKQPGRAALISAGAHGTLLGLLLLVGAGDGATSYHASIIEAVLVTRKAPEVPAAVPTVPSDHEVPAEPSTPAPEPEERAPQTLEPAPEAALATESPPAEELEPRPPERNAEPPSEPPRGERAADIEAAPTNATPAPIDDAAATPVAATATPDSPSQPLAIHEERALRERLASWTGRFTPEASEPTLTWREAGQEYTAALKKLPAADAVSMEQLAVEITTERDGNRLATELRMNRLAFSNFAQFIDRWDPEVQIHADVIDGRFHSNSEIRVSREDGVQPVFNGKVTLAARDIRSDGVGYLNRRTLFPAGIETSVRRIVLPPRAATLDARTVPAERTQRFERDALITFYGDGSFGWRELEGVADEERRALGDEPFYLVGADEVALHVHGTVNGKVLVYSPLRIVITDDLRYADDAREPDASDYLGLVADRTVEIDEPEITGPGDLEIDASIYARSRFVVRSYRSRRSGTLRLYGSLTAGSVSATEPRFATKIEFDQRLTTMRAPNFPLSDRYELDSLSGEWRALPAR